VSSWGRAVGQSAPPDSVVRRPVLFAGANNGTATPQSFNMGSPFFVTTGALGFPLANANDSVLFESAVLVQVVLLRYPLLGCIRLPPIHPSSADTRRKSDITVLVSTDWLRHAARCVQCVCTRCITCIER
jgi:hypothetical protein